MQRRRRFLAVLALAALAIAPAAGAAEVGGVKLPDNVTVGGTPLVLNGAGVRTRLVFKVYVASLYVPRKTADVAAVLAPDATRRVQIDMLRNVSADDFAGALNDGLRANNSEAELAALKAQVDQLTGIMKSFGEAKEGQVITLDYIPGHGTVVAHEGKLRGAIAGEPFNRALMKIWLGDRPIQADLKKAMLGG